MIRSKSSRQVKFISEINITPFTDVCLVLLIIFMVTAPEMVREEKQFRMHLPQAATALTPMPATVTVAIAPDQQVFVNNKPSSFETLRADIKKVHDETQTRYLVVRADETVPYRLVIQTIDTARSVGVDQIGLAARQQETSPQEQP